MKGHYVLTVTLAKVDIGIGLSHTMNGNILHSCMLRSSGSAKVNKYLDYLQRYYCHSVPTVTLAKVDIGRPRDLIKVCQGFWTPLVGWWPVGDLVVGGVDKLSDH